MGAETYGPKPEGGGAQEGDSREIKTFEEWLEQQVPYAYDVGLLPHEIDNMTASELFEVIRSRDRARRATTWQVACLMRVKNSDFPSYEQFVDPKPPRPREEMHAEYLEDLEEMGA